MTSKRFMQGEKASQILPSCCQSIVDDKCLLFEPECALLRRLKHNSVGLLRIRGRPTFRDIACARLASATAPTSCQGKKSSGSKSGQATSQGLFAGAPSRQQGPSSFAPLDQVTVTPEKYQRPQDDPARPHETHHAAQTE